jgi:hypothetical protein
MKLRVFVDYIAEWFRRSPIDSPATHAAIAYANGAPEAANGAPQPANGASRAANGTAPAVNGSTHAKGAT